MSLSEKIKNYRKMYGYTQMEFATLAGITRVTVQAIERGRVENPGMETLMKIAHAMQITLDELVKEE